MDKIDLATARLVHERVSNFVERWGYIASLYGSTLTRGLGDDIDVLLSPVTPLAMMPRDVVAGLSKLLGAAIEREAVGYYAHAFILSGKIGVKTYVLDLAIRYQNADEGHRRGWDEAQIFPKKERFALSGGAEVTAPLLDGSDD